MQRTMKTILIPIMSRSNRVTYINPTMIESLEQTSNVVTITMRSGAKHSTESDDLRMFAAFLKSAENAVTIADDGA